MKPDYDTDFYEWTQNQAAALVAGHLSELDLVNLAEEIASLGKRDRRGLGSRVEVLIIHLLKWLYQPERRETGHIWEDTILEQRGSIAGILKVRGYPGAHRAAASITAPRIPWAVKNSPGITGGASGGALLPSG